MHREPLHRDRGCEKRCLPVKPAQLQNAPLDSLRQFMGTLCLWATADAIPATGSNPGQDPGSNDGSGPKKLVQSIERHPGLALPALWFSEASAVLLFGDGWDEAPVGVYGLEGSLLGRYVVGERTHHRAARHRY